MRNWEKAPPKWADKFLEWYCKPELLEEIQGDIYELFDTRSLQKGIRIARLFFMLDVIRSFRLSTIKHIQINFYPIMLGNHLKIASRTLLKQKIYALINILGFALGIICSLYIYLWVQDEMGKDRFHENGKQLYSVLSRAQYGNKPIKVGKAAMYPLEATLEEEFAEIENVVSRTWPRSKVFKDGDDLIKKEGFYASKEFFEVFSFPLLKGNPSQVLTDPSYGVISVSFAIALFGEGWQEKNDLIGQVIHYDKDQSFTLMGVFEDVPQASTIKFDYILPIKAWVKNRPWDTEHWGNYSYLQVAQVQPKANIESLNQKVASTIFRHHKYIQEDTTIKVEVMLYPFEDMYLQGEFENGEVAGGRMEYVKIFSLVAMLVLVLACINFMNLATAKSFKRAREIGIRKVVGASRVSLVRQYLVESFVLVLFASFVALIALALLLPSFNLITNKSLVFPLQDLDFWKIFSLVVIFTTLLAGMYPAFFLASFKVTTIFRGSFKFGYKGISIRKILVLFQFVISMVMIMAVLIVHWQTHFLHNQYLGMDKDQVLYFYLGDVKTSQQEAVKQELLQNRGIHQVSFVNQNPVSINNSTIDPEWEGMDPADRTSFRVLDVDTDFLTTMNIPLTDGRNFDANLVTDTAHYVINETAAKAMGLIDPIGIKLSFWEGKGEIIGVIKDFHLQSLHEAIPPLILRYRPDEVYMALVKTKPSKIQEAITGIESLHQKYNPESLFEYWFLDEEYAKKYKSEATIVQLTNAFAILSIMIASLGLIGLASYATTKRTKEIGIRKALGATIQHILWLLTKDFMLLAGFASFIAIPLAYFLLSKWLENYSYRIDLSWWLFVLPVISVGIVIWIVVSSQSYKAALTNPTKALKSD
ncbi:MAG: FtsX-like permease family protein [Bacteroidota bacterium]